MKRNFLLLFLMALLPLSGWATITITTQPTLSVAVDYTGSAKQAVTAAAEATATNAPTIYYAVTTGSAPAENSADWKEGITNATATNAGTYKVYVMVQADEEETLRQYVGDFTINKVNPTLSTDAAAVAGDLTYNGKEQTIVGTEAATSHGTITYSLEENGTYTETAPKAKNAGTYKLYVKVTGDANHNDKTFTYDDFKVIGKKAFNTTGDFTVTRSAASATYNGAVQACPYVITYTEGSVNETLNLTEDYTVTYSAGAQAVSANDVTINAAGDNFSGSFTKEQLNAITDGLGVWTINKKPITVRALDQTKVYDGTTTLPSSDVDVAYQIIGVVDEEVVGVPTLAVTDPSKNVGEYIVTPSACAGANVGNYSINYVAAKFTITAKSGLTITADNKTKVKTNPVAADPAFTYTVTGFVNVDGEEDAIKAACNAVRDAGETVGTYTITLAVDNTADAIKNYSTITTNNGTFTITGSKVLITVLPKEKTYGDSDPEFDYILSNNDGNALQQLPTLTREQGEDVNTYTITASGAVAPQGYEGVDYVEGTLTIKKAPLTVTLPVQNIAADLTAEASLAALDATGITITGWIDGDAPENLSTVYDLGLKDGLANDGGNPAKLTAQTVADGYKLTLKAAIFANYGVGAELAQATSGKLVVGTGTAGDLPFTSVDADATTIANKAGETQNVTINFTQRNNRNYGSGTGLNWQGEKWTTMVLPFDITVADLSQALGYAIVNIIDATKTVVNGTGSKFYGKLIMKGGYGEDELLKANKPFLVKMANDMNTATNYPFGNRKIVASADPSVDAGQGAKFVGTYTSKQVTGADDAAIWFMNGNETGWQYINSGSESTWTIVPFEAYIDMSSLPEGARNITFYAEEIDGTVTAIKGISVDAAADAKAKAVDGWYNLNGVKMQGAPTQKGIYINNGKKIVVK